MHRRVGVLLFAAGWGANHFSTLLVVYRRDLGLPAAALGILFGAYALGLVPGLILAGRASDRWGRRALVLPASVVALGGSAILGFGTRGFAVLLAGRLVYGLGMGAVMSPCSVWLQELSPPGAGPRRATLALSAGFGLGPVVSGAIAELAPAPMVVPYIVCGLVMLAAIAGVRSVPETALHTRRATGGGPDVTTRIRPGDLRVLLELLPIAPWAFGVVSVTLAVLPGLMRPLVSHPVLYSGFVIFVSLATGVLAQPLVRRLGRPADLVGLAVGTVGIVLGAEAVALSSPALVFAVAPLAGFGYGMVMTAGLAEVTARVPARARGTAVGIYYVLTYIGFALPFVHAKLAKDWGDRDTLLATAAVAVVSLIIRALVELGARRRAA